MTNAISTSALTRRYRDGAALDDVTVNIADRCVTGLLGHNGAGKSTFMRVVTGQEFATGGTVRVFGADPVRTHAVATRAIGYLSQRFSLYGDLSIDENIEFFARLHGVAQFEARRTRLLDLTGLARFRARLADRLSGGMKQKLALACTLVHEPPLLVLDEPTTGVDPVSRREFWKLLAEFQAQGLTMVMATHDLNLAASLCDTLVLLRGGRVLASGSTREVLTSAAVRQLYDVEADVRMHELAGHLTVVPLGRL